MEKREAIEKFADSRPEARGVYGYGSGVFKQARRKENERVLTDAIFIVDDLQQWHRENMFLHPTDYSFIGRIHLNRRNVEKVKGPNRVTYFSEIKDGEYTFKYGVIEIQDFISGLETWNNLFMAGRFHKPVMEISTEDVIRQSIAYNRKCALMIACLFCERVASSKEIYNRLCGLSYLGDARMGIAENPHKVEDIVCGSYDKIREMYPLKENFLLEHDISGIYTIRHDILLSRLSELPEGLLHYLYEMEVDLEDLDMVRIHVGTYILQKNKEESRAQILEGIKTNGIVRSIPYALAKVRKRFGK